MEVLRGSVDPWPGVPGSRTLPTLMRFSTCNSSLELSFSIHFRSSTTAEASLSDFIPPSYNNTPSTSEYLE